jgi:hypothetical protein
VKVNLDALRIARQNELSVVDYHNLMLDRLDEVSNEREKALGEIERDKLRVARTYNKSETLFGRRFCLLGLEATCLGSDRQIGKYRIGLRK